MFGVEGWGGDNVYESCKSSFSLNSWSSLFSGILGTFPVVELKV